MKKPAPDSVPAGSIIAASSVFEVEASPGIEPGCKDLQSSA
jgi:hypothetical protein